MADKYADINQSLKTQTPGSLFAFPWLSPHTPETGQATIHFIIPAYELFEIKDSIGGTEPSWGHRWNLWGTERIEKTENKPGNTFS